ncbi:Ltp family lipoprotein [Rhizobium sp. NRK18]|uniref:Ltp family lipoprotein n=1 Tax=Rhizobium sp. NRK18 TaxID=2964667 RepID=UPI0021C2D78F|nr:Ltp family lipoprotein [Rhizobium sp. NRK18]MCQ2004415.1 Ltp family lipoprotein [Rhizobium sp. NRK18]
MGARTILRPAKIRERHVTMMCNHIGKIIFWIALMGTSIASAEDLTGPQQNAARSAMNYLSMTGFSRAGLIEQLSSSYGDQYDVADATAAVDSLSIDWNEQAVRSAKQYLQMMGFSCKGLVQQLSANSGDKYTKSQATYGAQHAGAC